MNSQHPNIQAISERLIHWYENFRSDSIHELQSFYADELNFKDPFYEFQYRWQLENLYEDLAKKIPKGKFIVDRYTIDEKFQECLLYFRYEFPMLHKTRTIHGHSRLIFSMEKKKFILHHDYWDSVQNFWTLIPVLGHLVKFFYKIAFPKPQNKSGQK